MSAEDFLIDAATRRSVFLQRYAGGVSKDAQAVLQRMSADIQRLLDQEPSTFQYNRLKRLMETVKRAIDLRMTEIDADLVDAVFELAKTEASFSSEMFNQAVSIPLRLPTEEVLRSAIFRNGMDVSTKAGVLTIEDAIKVFAKNKTAEIFSTLQNAVLNGVPTQEASKQVADLIGVRQSRQIDTLSRTIINYGAVQARSTLLAENAAVVDKYEWISVLDHRTTLLCAGRDGKIYKTAKGPLPPAHFGCRSTIVPKVKKVFAVDDLEGQRKAEGEGEISPQVTYGPWLARQPAEFQDETLGPSRAKLFRDGQLEIERFRDETGIVYSLERLQQLEPMAFQRAGVRVDGRRLVARD